MFYITTAHSCGLFSVYLMHMCSCYFHRSIIHVFQPPCSFHVYKQRVEIKKKKEKKKKSEVGKPATLQTPHVPGPGIEEIFTGYLLKSVILHQNLSIQCTVSFSLVKRPNCSINYKMNCNPHGCVLVIYHKTICTDSNSFRSAVQ